MTGSTVAAFPVAALMLAGCGAARDPGRTPEPPPPPVEASPSAGSPADDAEGDAPVGAQAAANPPSAGTADTVETRPDVPVEHHAGDRDARDPAVDPAERAQEAGAVSGDAGMAGTSNSDTFPARNRAFALEPAERGDEPAGADDSNSAPVVEDPFEALDRAFASEAAGSPGEPIGAAGSRNEGTAFEDAFSAPDQAFAAEAAGPTADAAPAGGGGNTDAAVADRFAALEQAFAAEAAGGPAAPAAVDAGGGADTATADPFAALERAFADERDAENAEVEAAPGPAGGEPADAAVEDAFAALDRAFASEAAATPAGEEMVDDAGGSAAGAGLDDAFAGLEQAFAAEAADQVSDEEAVVVAVPAPVDVEATGTAASLILPLDMAPGGDAPVDAAAEPADLAAWVRAVNAGVTAAEEAAAEAEAAAAGPRSWFARTSACVSARDRLARARARVEALTVGASRPSFVTRAGGAEAHAELAGRLESADERARAACGAVEPPR